MSRKQPNIPVPEVTKNDQPNKGLPIVTEVRKYKVITPLYGGGEKPAQPDSVTVVRASEVRGHLRFWWRATRGGLYANLQTLSKEEGKIWGSASLNAQKDTGPSSIKISVSANAKGIDDKPFEVVANKKSGKPNIQPRAESSAHPYVAFPLQPKKEEASVGMNTQVVKTDVEFELEISYPENAAKDVHAALWAWETFGGIGGRTRRGFGALKLQEYRVNGAKKPFTLPLASQIKTDLANQLKEYVVEGSWVAGVPHLLHSLRIEIFPQSSGAPVSAWKTLISRYQAFRQFSARIERKTGRRSNFGLSIWPEANVLRSRLKRQVKWPDTTVNPTLVEKFPRSEFGLPILFHLPHDGNGTYTLQGGKIDHQSDKSYERLASRLILKPLACANDQYVGLAAVLVGPSEPPSGLQIKDLPVQKTVEAKLEKSEANSAPLNQILQGQTNVIEAFLKTLK